MNGLMLSAATAAALGATLVAQTPNFFASRVVSFDTKGGAGGGIFDPTKALGPPGGALDVHSLGIGGNLVLGFDVTVTDGPGADLIVSENPFFSGGLGRTFAEVVFVEVSSNGVDFARVPTRYFGPNVSPGPFGVVHVGSHAGFGGTIPVNVSATDPQDVVLAGGDAVDLADLGGHPLVLAGRVDLGAITRVRLVDVVDGVSTDSRGRTVRDAGAGSADIDAVTVVHHRGNLDPRGPRIDLDIPPDGDFSMTIADPDGIADLDPTSWNVALFGHAIPAVDLLSFSRLVHASPTSFTLRLGTSLPPGFLLHLATSIKDRSGNRSGAARARPVN